MKRRLVLFLAALLMAAGESFAWYTGTYSGTFDGGEYVITNVNSAGVLSIVTHGKPMPDFYDIGHGEAPWVKYNEMYGEETKIVKITTDASYIGDLAFMGFKYVSTIEAENCKKVGSLAFWGAGREGFTLCLPNVEEVARRAFQQCNAGVIALPKLKKVPMECFIGCPYLKQVDLGEDLTEIGGWAFGCCPMMWIDNEPNIILHGSKMPELKRGYFNSLESTCQPDTVNYERAYHYGTCFDDENLKKTRLLFPYITKVKHKKDCSLFYPQPDGLNFPGKPVILVSYDCYLNDKNLDSRISGWKDDANFYVGGRVETRENPISEKQAWRNDYIGWWHRGSLIGNEDINICTYQWKLKEYMSEDEAKAFFDNTNMYDYSSYDPTKSGIMIHDNLPSDAQALKKAQLKSGMPWMAAMQASNDHGGLHVKTPVIIPLMFGPSLNCYTTNSSFDGVQEIGAAAFAFTGLRKNMDLSNVTKVGSRAFWYSNFLTEATLTNLESMDEWAFASSLLKKVVLGAQPELKEIPAFAFYLNELLDEIYIGANITKIGNCAFRGTLLDSDDSGKGLFMSGKAPELGKYVFTVMTLSDEITPLEYSKIYLHYPFAEYASYDADGSVWRQMNRVSDISFPILGDGWTLYADGEIDIFKDIPDYSNETQQPWAKYRRYITEVVVEEGVTQIGNHAFHFNAEQSRLRHVELPASLKRIGNYAFAGNDELRGLYCNYANAYDVKHPNHNTSSIVSNLGYIALVDVEEIGDYAFSDCSVIGRLYLGQSIQQLGKYIVKGCPVYHIATYNAPINIDRYTFEGTTDDTGKPKATSDIWCDVRTEDFGIKLEYLTATWWSDLHYALGDKEVWYNTTFRSANFALLSDSTLYIWPVGDATDLLSYETWERDAIAWDQREVTSKTIDFGADNKVADKVKRVYVSGNVKSLGGACCFLPNLEEVSLPESLKKLRGTFYGCEKLRDVNLPYVEVLGGATGVTVSSQVNRFDKETHGVDLYKGTFAHCPNLENVIMPKVHLIGDSTFTGCYSLDRFDGRELMENADTICSYAFKDCNSLDYVDLYSAKYLGTNVFAGCTNIHTADLYNQQPKSGTFDGCSSLENVYMYDQIGTIGNKAFNGCNIKEIWISTPNPPDFNLNAKETIKDHIFNGQKLSEINVYTYGDFIERYRETPGWKEMTVRVNPYIEKQAAIPAGGYLTDENWTNPAKWEITVGRSLNIYGKNVLDVGDYIDERVSYYWDYIDEIHINSGITELKTKIQGPRVLGSASSPWEFCRKVYIPSTMEKMVSLAFNAHAVLGGNSITDVYCYAETPVDISYEYSEYDAGEKGKMIYGSTAFSAVMKYTGEGTESENEEIRKELCIPRLHVLAKKGVKEAYEAAAGYKDSFLEIVADLAEDGEVVVLDKYSVTFVDWDERWITTTVVEEGEAAVAPEDPKRPGAIFAGWDTDFDNVTENITVKALYNEAKFEVLLAAEHGKIEVTPSDIDLTAVPYGTELTFKPVPDEDYEFAGWADDDKHFGERTIIITSNVALTAKFALRKYTVTFLDWNASKLYEEQVEKGADAKGPDENPTREGYDFTGWEPDLKNITADRTVIAQYEKSKVYFTVTYLDWNAAKLYEEKVEEGHDAKGPDENPTREGYVFTGWEPDLKDITADRTVIAQYEKKGATGLNDLQGTSDGSARKFLRNGVLYIERGGKTYTVQGTVLN